MLTTSAKKVGQALKTAATQKPKGAPTIDTLFRAEEERQEHPPKAAVLPVVAVKGTRSDPCFPITHPQIKEFNAYLQSFDGERKAEHEANAVTTDVSKFLKYASPDKLNRLTVTEPQKAREYLEHPEKGRSSMSYVLLLASPSSSPRLHSPSVMPPTSYNPALFEPLQY